MKTSSIVASVLFGSMAAAAPMLNKRAYVTHTSTLIQTEVTYTTVYADEPAAKPSAAFFERPSGKPANAPSSAPTQAPVAPVKPSSAVAPVPVPSSSKISQQPAPTQAPPKPSTQAPAPPKPSTVEAPKPSTQAPAPVPSAPAPIPSAPAPVPAPAPSASKPATPAPSAPATGGSGSGEVHSGGSMTVNPFNGNTGSCGTSIANSDMVVALSADTYGPSTYEVATGKPTNKYCGMKINITYNGKTTPATIMDKCPGCSPNGLDLSPSLWKAVTGTDEGSRLYGMTWTAA